MTNRPSATVIVPALNEETNIAALIAEIQEIARNPDLRVEILEIIVVDNGSTDRTAEVVLAAGGQVVREKRRGYGRACLTGAEVATGEILIFMDGDRSEVPGELPLLVDPYLDQSTALAIGSRIRGDIQPGSLSPQQIIGNRVGAILIRLIHGIRVTDFGPYRIIRRDLLLGFKMREMTFGWPTEMIVRASKVPGGIIEIPVTCRQRTGGVSKVSGNIGASLLTGWRMLSIMIRIWRDGRGRNRSS